MTLTKVVWTEGSEARCIVAKLAGEEDGFLRFILADGRNLRLNRSQVTKLEEVRG